MSVKDLIDDVIYNATEFIPTVGPNGDVDGNRSVIVSFVWFDESNNSYNKLKERDGFIYAVTKFNADILDKYQYILDKHNVNKFDSHDSQTLDRIEEDLNDILYREYSDSNKKLKEKLKEYIYKEFNISKDGKQGHSLLNTLEDLEFKNNIDDDSYETYVEESDGEGNKYICKEEDTGFSEHDDFFDLGQLELDGNRIKFTSKEYEIDEDYKELFHNKIDKLRKKYIENGDFGNLNPMKDFQEAVAKFIEKMYDLDVIIKKEDDEIRNDKQSGLNRKDIIDYLDKFTSEYFVIRVNDHDGLKKIPGMIMDFNVIGHSFDDVYDNYLVELIINPTGDDRNKFCYRTKISKNCYIEQAHLHWDKNKYIGFSIID